jgi:hypothetical protein
MVIYRLISPEWANLIPKVLEGTFTEEQIKDYNAQGYNIYFLPNYPSLYEGGTVDGRHIDTFDWLFIDFDLKDGAYPSNEAFLEAVGKFPLNPTKIVESGHGIHVYWRVTDLDAKSYLRLQRRLTRHFNTDEAVGKIYQLMRYPNTLNTKIKDNFRQCEEIFVSESTYSCEDIDQELAPITMADSAYCDQHYNKTYDIDTQSHKIDEKLPYKFAQLLNESNEVRDIWAGKYDDRSKADYRLGHIMFASGFSKSEAVSVLVNSAKALARAPKHRLGYATNIVDKIWTFELSPIDSGNELLSKSVQSILQKAGTNLKGTRFPCWSYLDNTVSGFRLGQVIGLVAGVGVGKTAIALNAFEGFVQNNPDYDHIFVTLEQPENEIADRWRVLCGDKVHLHEKVQVLSNYGDDGSYRHLSLEEIEAYILKYNSVTGRKIGCVVIDHIGVLKKTSKDGRQSIEDICHKLKSFAVKTSTLLIIQSQAPREKSGIGDLELNKDAAYGTVFFEAYCDYLITAWQPLMRCYKDGAPTITAIKYCKIRHKNQTKDVIQQDVCYKLVFDSETQKLRELTENEETAFSFFLNKATNKRKQDRKTELVEYVSVKPGGTDGATQSNQNIIGTTRSREVH